jgi:tryptophan synthase alpha chain
MNRLDTVLASFKERGEKALVAFLTAGDPDTKKSLEGCKAVLEAGADILELGMPFSDPMADGPAIQEANIRALDSGQDMMKTLEMAKELTSAFPNKPLVLMGYANPVHHYGYEKFVKDAAAAGVDGLIIVDLPPEENEQLFTLAKQQNIHLIPLVTPTTNEARLQTILQRSGGFIYYVAVAGITGTKSAEATDLENALSKIKAATDLPVMTGFGIKTPEGAASTAQYCDGVVVGSALVKTFFEEGAEPLSKLTSAIKAAI